MNHWTDSYLLQEGERLFRVDNLILIFYRTVLLFCLLFVVKNERGGVDIRNRPRIPIPDEDPYSVAGTRSCIQGLFLRVQSLRGAIGYLVRLLTERLVVRDHPGALLLCAGLFFLQKAKKISSIMLLKSAGYEKIKIRIDMVFFMHTGQVLSLTSILYLKLAYPCWQIDRWTAHVTRTGPPRLSSPDDYI